MTDKLPRGFKDLSGVIAALGFIVLLIGGFTSINERITENTTNIENLGEDSAYTRDRVDDIYNYLLGEPR